MDDSEHPRAPQRSRARRSIPSTTTGRAGLLIVALLLAGLIAYAISRLNLGRVGHALITATPGWIILALALMGLSLLLRSVSWYEALRAALPEARIGWIVVARATMIGVMASAVFPGRIGEPTRIVVLSRRLEGPQRRLLPIVAGTVFSQTLINLLALAILASITFSSVPIGHGRFAAILAVAAIPLALCALVLLGPRLLRFAVRSRSIRVRLAAATVARLLGLARQGLAVFVTPRHGIASMTAQLLAWMLQWLACYAVLLALGLPAHGHARGSRRDAARRQRQRRPARHAIQRRRVPGRLPGRARRVRRRRRPGDRLRHHPAGRRGPRPRWPWACRRCSARV